MNAKFVVVGILFAIVVTFAASLGVGGVNLLGSGSADVKAQPVEVTSVDWELNPNNSALVNSAHVTIRATDGQTHTGDFYLTAKDSQGNVLAQQEISDFTFNGGRNRRRVRLAFRHQRRKALGDSADGGTRNLLVGGL